MMPLRVFSTRRTASTLTRLLLALLLAAGLLLALSLSPSPLAHAQARHPQLPARPLSGGVAGWITSAVSDGNSNDQVALFGDAGGTYSCSCAVSASRNGTPWTGWSAHQPPASSPLFSAYTTPAVVELASGSMVLLQTIAGQLWEQLGSGSPLTWGAWTPVDTANLVLSAPTIVSWGGTRVDAFAWINFYGPVMLHLWSDTAGQQWKGELLGGFSNADTNFAPTVVSRGAKQLDLFANVSNTNGQNEALSYEHWNRSTWSGWQTIGGALEATNRAFTPNYSIVTLSSNQLEIFGTWSDSTLRAQTLMGTTWSGWSVLGVWLLSNPTATSWASGSLTVCAIGVDRTLWCQDALGGKSGSWYSLGGGPFGSDPENWGSTPVSVATGVGTLDVFAVDTGDQVWNREGTWDSYHRRWDWTPWESLGYQIA